MNTAAGWYQAETDPPGTERFWDGTAWTAQQRQASSSFLMDEMSGNSVESNLVGVGGRVGARVIDWIVWLLLSVPLMLVSRAMIGDEVTDATANGARLPFSVLIISIITGLGNLALIVAYEVMMNSKFGGTLGKKVTKAKIVKLDGSAPSLEDQVKRLALYIGLSLLSLVLLIVLPAGRSIQGLPDLVMVVIGIASVVMIATSDNEQALWDKVSGTTVVRNTPR